MNTTLSRPTFLVKTAPQPASSGVAIKVSERAFYGGKNVRVGDTIYVWFSETKGGAGLAFVGKVEWRHSISSASSHYELTISILEAATGLTVKDLEPFRDLPTKQPIATLSAKLYRHSHDKITALSEEEAEYLRSFVVDAGSK